MDLRPTTSASRSRPYHRVRTLEVQTVAKRPPVEETTAIGRRLVEIRKARGITQIEMAKKLGATQSFVSKYERGDVRLTGGLIIKLAGVLGVSTDELLGVKESTVVKPPKDRRLLKRLQRFDCLSKRDREALLRTVDAFLSKAPDDGR